MSVGLCALNGSWPATATAFDDALIKERRRGAHLPEAIHGLGREHYGA